MKLSNFLFLFLTVYTVAENYQCDILGICKNSEFVGIVHHINTNIDCIDACLNDDECNWCTFDSDFSQCILFADCNKIDNYKCSNCLTNQKECGQFDCDVSGLCLVIKSRMKLIIKDQILMFLI